MGINMVIMIGSMEGYEVLSRVSSKKTSHNFEDEII